MARGGKRKTKYNVHLKNKGSDGSDEDFIVGEDGALDDESEDEYFLADDETEEFEEENGFDECIKKKIKKVGRPTAGRKSCQRRSGAVKSRNKIRISCSKKRTDRCNKKPRKKANISYREENKDSDFDDSDDDEDEEFAPDEVEFTDDDEESPRMKRSKEGRMKMQEALTAKGKKRKRKNAKASKKTKRKKTVKKPTLRRKSKKGPVSKRSTGNGRGSRKLDVSSNTDFMKSGFSDYEYTISDEEREQIREASEFCGRLTASMRSSSSLKTIKEKETRPSERKRAESKDKEKVVGMMGKQVCGICLSEEGNRDIRGILNCCSHYFCFSCIMEWSKVESRCPLCKQRFTTISKTKQLDDGNNLRDDVVPVPKRDQVYQPSEEELMAYIDPYENVVCTECHEGRDDELMLLCDVCDSPAHTYCVGLGRVVPDGNWYCDGCRPAVLPSSSAQALNPTPSQGENITLAVASSPVRENIDLNEVYVPDTQLSQETGHSIGHILGTFGSGAFTLHERRRLHHLLHNYRSRQSERSDGMRPLSGTSLFGSQNVPQPSSTSLRGRTSIFGSQNVPQPSSTSLRGQVVDHQASASTDCTELSGTTARIDHKLDDEQLCPGNRLSNSGGNACTSTSPVKERVQSMVKSHLKSLSRNMNLDYSTFKCVARTCTHTILAALELEHRRSEVFQIRTRPLVCDHFDDIGSEQIYPIGGQCSSCFDWFIRNVVREVMSTQRPLLSRN